MQLSTTDELRNVLSSYFHTPISSCCMLSTSHAEVWSPERENCQVTLPPVLQWSMTDALPRYSPPRIASCEQLFFVILSRHKGSPFRLVSVSPIIPRPDQGLPLNPLDPQSLVAQCLKVPQTRRIKRQLQLILTSKFPVQDSPLLVTIPTQDDSRTLHRHLLECQQHVLHVQEWVVLVIQHTARMLAMNIQLV